MITSLENPFQSKSTGIDYANMSFFFAINVYNEQQEYSVQLTFREQWLDERLKFDDIQGKLCGF